MGMKHFKIKMYKQTSNIFKKYQEKTIARAAKDSPQTGFVEKVPDYGKAEWLG